MKKRTAPELTLEEQLIRVYRRALDEGVPLQEIEAQVSRHLEKLEASSRVETRRQTEKKKNIAKRIPRAVRIGALLMPALFISLGLYLVANAVFPILGYYVNNSNNINRQEELAAPIPREDVLDSTPLIVAEVAGVADNSWPLEPTIVKEELDYTNLSNWFDSATLPELSGVEQAAEGELTYTLDIPKLNISNAQVTVGGTDLNKSLIAYPGTAEPGSPGAPVIFGHSVLRQFYNPSEKNPRRYNSIFSTIMTLQPGDKIYVTSEGVKYTYIVQEKTEVKPEDVYILNQDYSNRRLKLVTCVPEGTYLRRGVVTAVLAQGGE